MSILIPYNGKCNSIRLSKGLYLLEVWGAEGGNCNIKNNGGGYSSGILTLQSEKELFACVGGKGEFSKTTNPSGGFNGGASGKVGRAKGCSGGGGGATDFRLVVDSLDSRIIVAGGSGGVGHYISFYKGGFGGGHTGGTSEYDLLRFAGTGGTDSAGGKGGYFDDYINNLFCNASDGSLQNGGDGCTASGASTGGGAGGYYGGGGGSGYTSSILSKGKTLSGNENFYGPNGEIENGHYGDGFAKVTALIQKSKCSCFSNQFNIIFLMVILISSF